MECLPKNEILEFHPDTLTTVRKRHGFNNSEDIKKAVDELDEWVKKQSHFLKKDFSRVYLESIIISNKGSIERAKARLDKVCTLRTTMPHYFGAFHVTNDFKDLHGHFNQAILPKLTEDHNRILLIKTYCKTYISDIILKSTRYNSLFFDYLKIHDYSDGIIIIVDFRDASVLQLIRTSRLHDYRECAAVIIGAYGMRVKGMHLLSSSTLINILIWFLKQVLSTKLGNRVHVHRTLKTLYNFVPKEVLPIEYGGNERSFVDIHDEWINALGSDEFRQHLRDMAEARTDESLRKPSESKIYSIRNLNID